MATGTFVINASTDICEWRYPYGKFGEFATGFSRFGGGTGTGVYKGCQNFKNVNIPQGTTINSAILKLYADSGGSGVVNHARISAAAEDDAATPTTASGANGLSLSTAYVDWDPGVWVVDTQYTIDITAIIQEIVNRAGWVSGNHINIVIRDNGSDVNADRTAKYDVGVEEPQLYIDWVAGADVYISPPPLTDTDTFVLPVIHGLADIAVSVTDTIAAADAISSGMHSILSLLDSIMLYDQDPGIQWGGSINEALTLTDVIHNVWGISAEDWLWFIDSQTNSWNGREVIPDALNLYDLAIAAGLYAKEIDDSLGIADTTVYKLTVMCLEELGFTDLASMMKSVMESVSESMEIDDSLIGAYPVSITDALTATDSITVIGLFLKTVAESLGIADAATVIKAITMMVSDPIVFVDTVSTQGNLFTAVYDGLNLDCSVDIAGEVWECYVLNTPKFLPSMYSGFDFNSYCVSEGRVFGANDTGIFELTGSTDAGSKIHTGVILSATDFGAPNQKRFRRGYLGLTGDTVMMIFETETGQREAYVIDSQGKTVASGDLKSKKWKLSIVDFDTLDHLKLIPILLTK